MSSSISWHGSSKRHTGIRETFANGGYAVRYSSRFNCQHELIIDFDQFLRFRWGLARSFLPRQVCGWVAHGEESFMFLGESVRLIHVDPISLVEKMMKVIDLWKYKVCMMHVSYIICVHLISISVQIIQNMWITQHPLVDGSQVSIPAKYIVDFKNEAKSVCLIVLYCLITTNYNNCAAPHVLWFCQYYIILWYSAMNCDGSMHPVGMMSARLFLHTHPSKSWDFDGCTVCEILVVGTSGLRNRIQLVSLRSNLPGWLWWSRFVGQGGKVRLEALLVLRIVGWGFREDAWSSPIIEGHGENMTVAHRSSIEGKLWFQSYLQHQSLRQKTLISLNLHWKH